MRQREEEPREKEGEMRESRRSMRRQRGRKGVCERERGGDKANYVYNAGYTIECAAL